MPSTIPPPIRDPLPYEPLLEQRAQETIDLVVVHCTELPDLAAARSFGEQVRYPSGTGNSGHYYIDRDGTIHQYVDIARTAHHVRGYNPRSIGIELVNGGRFPHWLASGNQVMRDPYTELQLVALTGLLEQLAAALPGLEYIEGHEQLDQQEVPSEDDPSVSVRRKLDPGPLFPWPRVLASTRLRRLLPEA